MPTLPDWEKETVYERITVWYTRFLHWAGRKRLSWKDCRSPNQSGDYCEMAKIEELATKRDLKEMELKLESRIKDTELKIVETKAELIRWVVGVGLLQITIIAGLLFRLTGKI